MDEYNAFLNLFKRFLNIEINNKKVNLHFKDANSFLTEQLITQNFPLIFGYECPYFAKLIYLLLSKGYDKSKIGLSRFI